MKRTLRNTVLGLGAVLMLAGPASALTYDLRGGGGNLGLDEIFSTEGVDVKITGMKNFSTTQDAANIHQNGVGIGVIGAPSGRRVGNQEAVTLDWAPKSVRLLESVIFERDQNQNNILADIDLYVDGVFKTNITGGPGDGTFTASNLNFSGSSFTFVGQINGGSFRISEVTVSTTPEPASVVLLGTGIAGIGAWRWRKSRR